MATATPSPGLEPLLAQRRFIGWGLLWGGVMLAIMGGWLRVKYPDIPHLMVWALWLMAAGAVVLAILQIRRPAALQEASLQSQKRTVGGILIIVGIALVPAAGWLVLSHGVQALGEGLGLFTLSLIAIGTGGKLASPPAAVPFQERFLRGLIDTRATVSAAMVGLGGILAILGLWIRVSHSGTPEDPIPAFPFWFGPILFGLLFLGVGTYLRLTPELNLAQARMLVLLAGGGFGLILSVMTLCQAWIWRGVFFGGLPAWRGPQAWQLWLCAYLELIGLVLMFVCLNLARADIRVNPILRRALYGYNAVLMGLLLLVFLVVLNIVIFVAYPLTFNWSEKGGLYSLSTTSMDILEKLDKDTKIYVIMSPQTPRFRQVRYLLSNAQALTDKLEVVNIAPDRDDPKYDELIRNFPELRPDQFGTGRGLLLLYGPEGEGKKQPPHKFIAEDKLVESNPMQRRGGETFVGEKVLMSELQFLMTEKKKSKIYFLQGHGEMSLKFGRVNSRSEPREDLSKVGISRLIDRLRKENFESSGLSFGPPDKKEDQVVYVQESGELKRKEVPDDAGTVVIAAPSAPIAKETLDALERYLEGKGKLIVLMDVVTDQGYTQFKTTGLEDFLKKYNVEVTDKYVHSFGSVRPDPRTGKPRAEYDRAPTIVYSRTNPESNAALAKKFEREVLVLQTTRVVRGGPNPGRYQTEVLLEVPPAAGLQENIWAEDAPALFDINKFNINVWERGEVSKRRVREPLPVAVTVNEGGGAAGKPRLAVFGDAEWVTDLSLTRGTETHPDVYYSLFASTVDWLAERPGIGIRPREPGIYVMKSDVAKETGRLVWLPGWFLVLGTLGVGAGVWVVRRR